MNIMICLELMDKGTLDDFIQKSYGDVSLRKRFSLCKSLISGIRRIHSKGITHKDLKPDNIFLDEELDLKIGDLGLAYSEKNSSHLENLKQVYYYPSVCNNGVSQILK